MNIKETVFCSRIRLFAMDYKIVFNRHIIINELHYNVM